MKKHGKTLSFDDLRATYDPRNEAIILTSGDETLARQKWRVILNSHTIGTHVLRTEMQAAGIIHTGETLPPHLVAPKLDGGNWWEFPLGLTYGNEEVRLSLRGLQAHTFILGPTGTGKSIVQRSILRHVSEHMGRWDVLGIDLKRVELSPYATQPSLHENFTHVTELEEAVAGLRAKHELMMKRYELLGRLGQLSAFQLIDVGQMRAQLILVDEVYPLLLSDEVHNSPGSLSATESLQAEATHLLGDIARLGKAANVHLVLGTQRLDLVDGHKREHKVKFSNELFSNLTNRISMGQLNHADSNAMFNSTAASEVERVKGRGLVRIGADAEVQEVQFYHTAMSDFYLSSH